MKQPAGCQQNGIFGVVKTIWEIFNSGSFSSPGPQICKPESELFGKNERTRTHKYYKCTAYTHKCAHTNHFYGVFKQKKTLDIWLNGMTLCTSVLLKTMYQSYDDNVHIKHTTELCVRSAQFSLFIIIHII